MLMALNPTSYGIIIILVAFFISVLLRSIVYRRQRQRLMAQGLVHLHTWDPPPRLTRAASVDMSQKPVFWEACIDGRGNDLPAGVEGRQYNQGAPGKNATLYRRTDHTRVWRTIKPLSVAYTAVADVAAAMGMKYDHVIGASGLVDNSTTNLQRDSRPRVFFSRAMRALTPTPAPPPPPASTVPMESQILADSVRHESGAGRVLTELSTNTGESKAPTTAVRVVVLIAMPGSTIRDFERKDPPLPLLEIGVADVLVCR